MFGKSSSPDESLLKIRSGVKEFEKSLTYKQERLKELFMSLKEAILSSQVISLDHLRVLHKQVRHILSIARAIHDPVLEEAFAQEEQLLVSVEDLLSSHPRMEVSGSADLQAAIKNLQGMLSSQQRLVFEHTEILNQEKRRLVQILQEAEHLEEDIAREHQRSSSSDAAIIH